MTFPFNFPKAVQASGLLLSEYEGHCMERIRVLKLLYIAERTAVKETGRPMIGSDLVAMENGPLHSLVYDLMKDQTSLAVKWREFFEQRGRLMFRTQDPGVTALSRRDVRILEDIMDEFRDVDTWDLVEQTHEFEEWKKAFSRIPHKSSGPILMAELFEAVGLDKDDLEAFESQAEELEQFQRAS